MTSIETYREAFLNHMKKTIVQSEPQNLYQPIHYILELGGKCLRPVLTLMAADIFSDNYQRGLDAALAVEVFHNFSLVHDDIMDKAPLRRGKPTVHVKWDLNTAILSGDAMLIIAYQLFEKYPTTIFRSLAELFSRTALQVCEGQQDDMDFETMPYVLPDQYLNMIKNKTAVLVGAALQMGAITVEASLEDQQKLYDFGVQIGMAYQLQDDYLDTFGGKQFGKKIGGDILENKKTMLYIKALELLSTKDKTQLLNWYKTTNGIDEAEKIRQVKQLFVKSGADTFVRRQIDLYTENALGIVSQMSISSQGKQRLIDFGKDLINREV